MALELIDQAMQAFHRETLALEDTVLEVIQLKFAWEVKVEYFLQSSRLRI